MTVIDNDRQQVTFIEKLRAALVDRDGLDLIPDPEPLVGSEIIFRDSLVWMVGKPGSMKSFAALDIAGCIATGQVWHGHQVVRGPVLFLVAEGVRGTKKRVRAWEKSMAVKMYGVQFLPIAVQSKVPGQWGAFIELVRELRPILIVIDTQARVTVGVEENSNTDMGDFVDNVERLREAAGGACVMIVHHIGTGGERGRGATALDGAVSTIIKFTKEKTRVRLECLKNKDGSEWDAMTLRAVPTEDTLVMMLDDDPRGSRSGRVPDWVSEWWDVFESEPVSISTLEKTGVTSSSTFHREKLALMNAGVVKKEGTGNQTRYHLSSRPNAS
jgi:RecA-family ATPase